jgi:pantoate--beta-alanine ligase
MDHVDDIGALKSRLRSPAMRGRRIGLVPTMGALHAGHLSLVDIARRHADLVVASVFVNPKQFGAGEDLDAYPRDLDRDGRQLADAGCDMLFAPTVDAMYPDRFETTVHLERVSRGMEGEQRPGHFDGVATVVLKLFHVVRPDVAVFGEKDFQQLVLIRRMVDDLALDVKIIGAPLVRDVDGLALSSRNVYLSSEERTRARSISRGLAAAADAHRQGEATPDTLLAIVRQHLDAAGLEPEYLELRRFDDLTPVRTSQEPCLILVAVRVGSTRLLDNHILRRP